MISIRPMTLDDIPEVVALSQRVYGPTAWRESDLRSHLEVFPQGQLVAINKAAPRSRSGEIVGNAASLIVNWSDYDFTTTEYEITGLGKFHTHDPAQGRTLYGADVSVHPERRRMGIGKKIYAARRRLCRDLGLVRVRAAARLGGYHRVAQRLTPEDYVVQVINGELTDPTLSFQLREGFRVIAVVREHQDGDPESHGHVAIIEWVNHKLASPLELKARDPRFRKRRKPLIAKGKRDPRV